MSHWAKLNENNVVTDVIKARDKEVDEGYGWITRSLGGRWIKTSYNASSNGFRKNFAGPGYTYDESLDAFIPPKPFESWVLNSETCRWVAPIARPSDGLEKEYAWDEATISWVKPEKETPNE